MHKKRFILPVSLLKFVIHLACFLPLIYVYYQAYFDGLGADPVEAVIHFTGIGALNIFLMSLAISPIAKFFKLGQLIQVRRVVGLYAFTYAVFHLLNFLFFEVQFDLQLFFDEIFERPYITIGMVGFLILTALAVTSLTILRKKMGRKWQLLHNYTYLAGALLVIHFYWSVKSELIEPIIYILIFATLLFFRKDKIIRWFK